MSAKRRVAEIATKFTVEGIEASKKAIAGLKNSISSVGKGVSSSAGASMFRGLITGAGLATSALGRATGAVTRLGRAGLGITVGVGRGVAGATRSLGSLITKAGLATTALTAVGSALGIGTAKNAIDSTVEDMATVKRTAALMGTSPETASFLQQLGVQNGIEPQDMLGILAGFSTAVSQAMSDANDPVAKELKALGVELHRQPELDRKNWERTYKANAVGKLTDDEKDLLREAKDALKDQKDAFGKPLSAAEQRKALENVKIQIGATRYDGLTDKKGGAGDGDDRRSKVMSAVNKDLADSLEGTADQTEKLDAAYKKAVGPGRELVDVLIQMAGKLQGASTEARASILGRIFGDDDASRIAPLLDVIAKDPQGIGRMYAQMLSANLLVTKEQQAAVSRWQSQVGALQMAIGTLKRLVAVGIAPRIGTFITDVTKYLIDNMQEISGKLIEKVLTVADFVHDVVKVFYGIDFGGKAPVRFEWLIDLKFKLQDLREWMKAAVRDLGKLWFAYTKLIGEGPRQSWLDTAGLETGLGKGLRAAGEKLYGWIETVRDFGADLRAVWHELARATGSEAAAIYFPSGGRTALGRLVDQFTKVIFEKVVLVFLKVKAEVDKLVDYVKRSWTGAMTAFGAGAPISSVSTILGQVILLLREAVDLAKRFGDAWIAVFRNGAGKGDVEAGFGWLVDVRDAFVPMIERFAEAMKLAQQFIGWIDKIGEAVFGVRPSVLLLAGAFVNLFSFGLLGRGIGLITKGVWGLIKLLGGPLASALAAVGSTLAPGLMARLGLGAADALPSVVPPVTPTTAPRTAPSLPTPEVSLPAGGQPNGPPKPNPLRGAPNAVQRGAGFGLQIGGPEELTRAQRFKAAMTGVANSIKGAFSAAFKFVAGVGEGLVKSVGAGFHGLFKGISAMAMPSLRDVGTYIGGVASEVGALGAKVVSGVGTVVEAVGAKVGTALKATGDVLGGFWTKVGTTAGGGLAALRDKLTASAGAIGDFFKAGGGSWGAKAVDSVSSVLGRMAEKTQAFEGVLSKIPGKFSSVFSAGAAAAEGWLAKIGVSVNGIAATMNALKWGGTALAGLGVGALIGDKLSTALIDGDDAWVNKRDQARIQAGINSDIAPLWERQVAERQRRYGNVGGTFDLSGTTGAARTASVAATTVDMQAAGDVAVQADALNVTSTGPTINLNLPDGKSVKTVVTGGADNVDALVRAQRNRL